MKNLSFTGWNKLQLQDLFYAYRKAKADCYFERITNVADKFVEFESQLVSNLKTLLEELQNFGPVRILDQISIANTQIVAKKLSPKAQDEIEKNKDAFIESGHIYFSDSKRTFEHIKNNFTPEFRIVGHFDVRMHVLSALWINLVGRKYDQLLTSSSYGNRLRRYKAPEGSPKGTLGDYHLNAVGSFNPYFQPYRDWREKGLKTLRTELENGESVIAVSLDIQRYYHTINPRFLIDTAYLEKAKARLSAKDKITQFDVDFTKSMIAGLEKWSSSVVDWLGIENVANKSIGIPIGLSMSHVIANALLVDVDKEIKEALLPIYYGRYVDDIFLVLKDSGQFKLKEDLWRFIAERTKSFSIDTEGKEISLDVVKLYSTNSQNDNFAKLKLQKSKQRAFFLDGQAGLDLLDNIEQNIRSVSSERRLMPSADKLDSTASAKVLSAAGHPSDEPDTIRKADGLTLKRLSWSVQLRAVEILARDLDKSDWAEERRKFYQFAENHILRPDKILENSDYLPRLLSIAVSLRDWVHAKKLLNRTEQAVGELRRTYNDTVIINGLIINNKVKVGHIWDGFERMLKRHAYIAVLQSVDLENEKFKSEAAKETLNELGLSDLDEIRKNSVKFHEADLGKVPYKKHICHFSPRESQPYESEICNINIYEHFDPLRNFLETSIEKRVSTTNQYAESYLPYLFPTRPYSTSEISLYLPKDAVYGSAASSGKKWAQFVRAVRGIWVWGHATDEQQTAAKTNNQKQDDKLLAAQIGRKKKTEIILGITSLRTDEISWRAGAAGVPDVSRIRHEKIVRLINQIITTYPRPTHVLLPELCLPERWLDTISSILFQEKISLIAGLDYKIVKDDKGKQSIHSEAALVLIDDRLGFDAAFQLRQSKIRPAPLEAQELRSVFGQEWTTFSENDQKKVVYNHNGFFFGVLICSELQNIKHRFYFQGEVDCLAVLSWNRDLETFSSLVESASLDTHAYIALVNNRCYGDSRVRIPSKDYYKRDLCRIKGGENDYVVSVKLDIEALRKFQSRFESISYPGDLFKPVPEGFQISDARKIIP